MTRLAQQAESQDKPLPALRGDLQVEMIAPAGALRPVTIVRDPVRGVYFRMEWPQGAMFLQMQTARTCAALQQAMREAYCEDIDESAIVQLVEFCFANAFTRTDQDGGWRRFRAQQLAAKKGLAHTLIHSYLFFRIPLLHPDRLLQRLLPPLSFVFSRVFWLVISLAALTGVYLATRQWTSVVSAVRDIFRLEGLALYAFALLALKAFHEFGHGLACARYRCHVPGMGIAVMVGAPVFYTDTSDSWRLPRRGERLRIVFAGVCAEMIVATLALFAWVFLQDGLLRQTCFALATTSVVMSLMVNLNPLMRFDGYYALSDYLGVPNLQSRSFALALWRLREFLFNLREPAPEVFAPPLARTLKLYAAMTAVYRFFLFSGIAFLLLTMAGKTFGLVLAVIEILIFIVMPVVRELREWWKRRALIIRRMRFWLTCVASSLVTTVFFIPWIASVEAPAVVIAAREEAVFFPSPAQIIAIHVRNGQQVRAGEPLFAGQSPQLRHQRDRAALEAQMFRVQLAQLASNERDRQLRYIIESNATRALVKNAAFEQQLQQLSVRAPFDGRIEDMDRGAGPGVWFNGKQPLARLISLEPPRAVALAPDSWTYRIAEGAQARFVPDDAAAPSRQARVTRIAPASDGRLAEPALADRYGGGVAVGERKGELALRSGWIELQLSVEGAPPPSIQRGVMWIEASPVSPAAMLWQRLARIFVREQTF